MERFPTLAALRSACLDLPAPDHTIAVEVAAREAQLTKPPGSLGRLEEIARFMACWQGRTRPKLDRVSVLVFAGNHGVAELGVSAFPAAITAQMVANFAAGGAAINQLARNAGAELHVTSIELDRPTGDFTAGPAMSEAEFLDAVATGAAAVGPDIDLLCLGEMGIANTTAAAAVAAGLFGGTGEAWAGRGTGVDDAGLARKREVIDRGLARHAAILADPLQVAACLGGRELAAMLGAALEARHRCIPVLLDGFVCTAAVAPLFQVRADGLDHTMAAHVSAESGHRRLLAALKLRPLLDLGMRLGEASGAALAIPLVRAAIACHTGMATFAEAGLTP